MKIESHPYLMQEFQAQETARKKSWLGMCLACLRTQRWHSEEPVTEIPPAVPLTGGNWVRLWIRGFSLRLLVLSACGWWVAPTHNVYTHLLIPPSSVLNMCFFKVPKLLKSKLLHRQKPTIEWKKKNKSGLKNICKEKSLVIFCWSSTKYRHTLYIYILYNNIIYII